MSANTKFAPTTISGRIINDPPLLAFSFRMFVLSWIWLIVRLYLGYQWVEAGMHKVQDVKWVGTGEALQGFWANAIKIPETGRPPFRLIGIAAFSPTCWINEAYTWFGKVVAYGELLIGVALIVGAFVGIAAFFGAFLNWNFIMAGAASTNGMLLVLALFLMLAWKVAGYYGADFILLRYLGVPWTSGEEEESRKSTTGQLKPSLR